MKENNELTRDDIAIDHDMEVDCDEGREIAVYIETWFDVDRKFHIDTASNDDTRLLHQRGRPRIRRPPADAVHLLWQYQEQPSHHHFKGGKSKCLENRKC